MEKYSLNLEDGTSVEKRVLDNGFKLIHQNLKNGCVTLYCAVGVGSNYETPEQMGISHFVEHMIFRGTSKRSGIAVLDEVEGVGGIWDGQTSENMTEFSIRIAKEYCSSAVGLIYDVLFNSDFGPRKIDIERGAILAELIESKDNIQEMLELSLLGKLYSAHPVRNPILGTEETLKSLTREQMISYYNSFYAPNNMALAVVGDINEENLIQIEKIFSKPEKREVLNYNPVNEPALDKPVSYQKEIDVIGAHTLIGIHLRKGDEFLHINHPDYFVLKVINETLGNSRMTSRLFREIREKRGLVYDIDSNIESHRDISHISFDFVSEKENFDKVVSILFEQLNKIRTEKMPEDELVKVKSRILSQYRFGNSDDKKRADSFATYEAAGWGGIEEFSRHNEKIMKVTADDVLRVANEFINPEKYALVKFIPKA